MDNSNGNITRYRLKDTTDESDNFQFTIMEIPSFFERNGTTPCNAHIHDFYQIIWFMEGDGVHCVDFKEYNITPNTLFFISPGQVHCFDRPTDSKGVIIHFNESYLSDEGSSENVFLKYNIFNALDTTPCYTVSDAAASKLEYLACEMKNEMRNFTQFAHADSMKYLLKLFLINVQRFGIRGDGVELDINNSSDHIFVRFRQSLEHHYRAFHSVKEYANLLNVSSKTLTNAVSRCSHTTPLNIINDRILLEAKRQLLYSDLKVKEIAYQLGFEDPSYFVKFFKRKTGYSPADFREM